MVCPVSNHATKTVQSSHMHRCMAIKHSSFAPPIFQTCKTCVCQTMANIAAPSGHPGSKQELMLHDQRENKEQDMSGCCRGKLLVTLPNLLMVLSQIQHLGHPLLKRAREMVGAKERARAN